MWVTGQDSNKHDHTCLNILRSNLPTFWCAIAFKVRVSHAGKKDHRTTSLGISFLWLLALLTRGDNFKIDWNKIQLSIISLCCFCCRFLTTMHFNSVIDIDSDCSEVYEFWPEIYHNLRTLYKEHKAEMEKYISVKNRPRLYDWVKKNGLT